MTTRMQQRRGTATQWTSGNPVLAAGEIGFETNTNKFKIGDGTSTWSDLKYFLDIEKLNIDTEGFVRDDMKGEPNGVASLNGNGQIPISQLGLLINAAPGALDTLGELADAVEEIANIATGITSTHAAVTTNVHGIVDTSVLATATTVATAKSEAITAADTSAVTKIATAKSEAITAAGTAADTKVSTAVANETTNRGIAIASALSSANSELSAHESDTTNVHGIADTSLLATVASSAAGVETHRVDTTNVHGIADTSLLATIADVETHRVDTTDVHGIADTSLLATVATAAAGVETHRVDTTNVHGIADTSALALTATVNSGLALKADIASPTFTGSVSGITKSMVGLGSADNTADADKPVSSAASTAIGLKANSASPTFTGTVSGITKSMVDLGNVDNTADSAKPVSTAGQTALDLKAPLASPALTGVPTAPTAAAATNTTQVATTAYVRAEVAALVNSAGATLDTLGEIATALGNDANLSTTLTNAIALKAPLASPTFTGTNTVAALTASGLITASASGVAFTDGTQTKEGVASRTPIVQKTASYTLSALTERDSLIEVSSASAVTITVPTNATLALPVGTSIDILQTGAGQVTIAGASGVTVNATPGLKLRTQWSGVTLFKRATDTWVVYGDLTV